MREKTTIGYIPGAVDSAFADRIFHSLEETHPGQFEIVELKPEDPYAYGKSPLDMFCSKQAIDLHLTVINRQSFRKANKDRIDRYNRVWPRHGAPMLLWNRKLKWLPRFFSRPSRRLYFSQSQLRLSQVMSWRVPMDTTPHTVCSLADLDLSRWPSSLTGT